MRRVGPLLALALVCLAPGVAGAQSGGTAIQVDPSALHRWHLPRRSARDPLTHDDPPPTGRDWSPLSGPARSVKEVLRDSGVVLDVDTAFYDQRADKTTRGEKNLATFAWQAVGDWRLNHDDRLGTTYLGWTFLGSSGLDYDTDDESLSGNVGSISGLNANVFPDSAAMDELFLKQVSPGGRLIVLAGRVDTSFYFDTNRVANNGFRQFFSFALENNLSIPWSLYGGLGALVRFNFDEDHYVMAAATSSASDEPWAPWKSLDDNAWGQSLEVGVTRKVPGLGKGHYRITPWHNHAAGEDGFGLALNLDQELGLDRLVAFLRFGGIGDRDVTPVKRFVSGGLAFEKPFGREDDAVGLGVAWSDPSPGGGVRNETLLELYYRLELSPSIALTPDIQVVLDPADSDDGDTTVVLGVRLQLRF